MGDVPAEAAGHEPDNSAAEGRNGADAADDERRHAGDAAWGHGREPDADDDAADGE